MSNFAGAAPSGDAAHPPPVPPAPRPLSTRALRRSWVLPQVRVWWVMTAAVVFVAVGVGLIQYQTWAREAKLIRRGLQLQAKLVGVMENSLRGKVSHPGEAVYLQVEQDGQTRLIHGSLPQRNDAYVNGTMLPIRVDPNDPDNWTLQTKLKPLVIELMGTLTLTPLILLLGVAGWLRRRRVLRIWANGEARETVVLSSSYTAAAPDARLVRCALREGKDQRVLRVLVPRSAGRIHAGESLWILTPPGALEPALPVAAYPG